MIIVIGCPTISAAVYPNKRSAPLFQLVTMPLRSLLMMASSDESMIALSKNDAASPLKSSVGDLALPVLTPFLQHSTHPAAWLLYYLPRNISRTVAPLKPCLWESSPFRVRNQRNYSLVSISERTIRSR